MFAKKPSSHRRALVVLALLALFGVATTTSPAADEPSLFEPFGPEAFAKAVEEDRLVLLVLEVPWSAASQRARAEVWSDPAVRAELAAGFVAMRARADLRPELMRRYPAEGWPAVSVLLPDGAPFFVALPGGRERRLTSGFRPAGEMARLLGAARRAWGEARAELAELAHSRLDRLVREARPVPAPLEDLLVWNSGSALRHTFDPGSRYFGGAPRLPRFDLIELLFALGAEGEPDWATIASAGLDTMTRRLRDPDSGALYRMALGADWSDPQRERLLDRNARLLELLALDYRRTGEARVRRAGLEVARFITETLSAPSGAFYAGACEACPEGLDRTILSGASALASAALLRAGAAFGEPALIERGLEGVEFIARERLGDDALLRSAERPGSVSLPLYLEDLAQAGWAFLAAYELGGREVELSRARRVIELADDALWDDQLGAYRDVPPQPSGPLPLRASFYPLLHNVEFARVLARYGHIAGDDRALARARRVLETHAGSRERVPLWTPAWTLAAHEALFEPIEVYVTGGLEDGSRRALGAAAMSAEHPYTLVVSPESAERPLVRARADEPARLVAAHGSAALKEPLDSAGAVRGALVVLRERALGVNPFVEEKEGLDRRRMRLPPGGLRGLEAPDTESIEKGDRSGQKERDEGSER